MYSTSKRQFVTVNVTAPSKGPSEVLLTKSTTTGWSRRHWVAVAGAWTIGHVVVAAVVGVSVPDPTERGLAIAVVVAVAILGLLIILERNVQHHEVLTQSVKRKLKELKREAAKKDEYVVEEVAERMSLRNSSVVWMASFVFVAVIVAIILSQTMPTAASRGLSAASVSLFAVDAVLAYYAWRKHHRAGDERLTHDYKTLKADEQVHRSHESIRGNKK